MSGKDEPIVVREGYPFIGLAGALALFTAAVDLHGLAWILLFATFAVGAFFRNPFRRIPQDPRAVLCPADGRILEVRRQEEDALLTGPHWKVSIFMSPLDVHVNRAPVSGIVRKKIYHPGCFHVASLQIASTENERMEMVVEAGAGFEVGIVQVAGRIARRIVCYPQEGDSLVRGERFGLIRFGSRVELYLPGEVTPTVQVGQRVKAGETIMGHVP
jgi:phosphatidylserine decarboxylase